MNNGAFGENFPYSNFHDLNMDWIIKIAKDFLDQYTHIQDTIQTGLDDLDAKATELEGLLQSWYDTHSDDIAEQLAQALANIDTTLNQSIATFNAKAEQKANQTIASIPDDYTALANKVLYLIDGLRRNNIPGAVREGVGFISSSTGELVQAGGNYGFSNFIRVYPGEEYYYYANASASVLAIAGYENEYDTTAVISESVVGTGTTTGIYKVPSGINYIRLSSNPWINVSFEKVPTLDTVRDSVSAIIKAGNVGKFIEPVETYKYQMFNRVLNDFTTITRAQCQKFTASSDAVAYSVSTHLFAGSQGYPVVTFFDASDNIIGYEHETTTTEQEIYADKEIFYLPPNCSYFLVNARNEIPEVKEISKNSSKINREISILFIGNSLLQDGIAYLPSVLSDMFPFIDFKFYMWYIAGSTLHDQYEAFTGEVPADLFSIAVNTPSWTNLTGVTMIDVLEQKRFNIVCMEEYFNYKSSYTEADLEDWNNCQDYIRTHYLGLNPLEFITYFHAPLRTRKEEVYTLTKEGCALILKNTIADDMLGCGMAIYNALDTAIGTLGDGGDMTTGDRTHAQEGIPCLVQTYTVVNWLLNRLGVFGATYDMKYKMTSALYDTLNIPGANLGTGVITGDNTQNNICCEVAIKSYKEAKQFVVNNEW